MTRLLILTLVILLVCRVNLVLADCTGCTDNNCTCGGTAGQQCDQSHCTIPPRCDAGGCNQDGTMKPRCCMGFCSQVNATRPKCTGGHCNQDGATDSAVCTGGDCSQVDTEHAVCTGGDCDQTNSISPACTGGSCTQIKARGKANCVGGSCNSAGAEAVSCVGGSCCVDGTEKSVSCIGGGCNANAKSCDKTGCGGKPCRNTFPAGLSGTCIEGGSEGHAGLSPYQALKLFAALIVIVVLCRQSRSSPQQTDETALQQPLLDSSGDEDPSGTTAEISVPILDAEASQEIPVVVVATGIDVEEQEVTGSVQDTNSASQEK